MYKQVKRDKCEVCEKDNMYENFYNEYPYLQVRRFILPHRSVHFIKVTEQLNLQDKKKY